MTFLFFGKNHGLFGSRSIRPFFALNRVRVLRQPWVSITNDFGGNLTFWGNPLTFGGGFGNLEEFE